MLHTLLLRQQLRQHVRHWHQQCWFAAMHSCSTASYLLGTLHPDTMRACQHQLCPTQQTHRDVLAESALRTTLQLPIPTMWLHAMEKHCANSVLPAMPGPAPAVPLEGPSRESAVQLWAESVRRKRFSKMKKHKHRKRLKKLRRQNKK